MQGHFDLQMLHTPGLTRELIEAVRREGGDPKVEEYLRRFHQDGEWHTDNLVYQTYPSFLFVYAMSATTMYWGQSYPINPHALAHIQLSSTSSEPSYSTVDAYNNYAFDGAWTSSPDLIGSGSTSLKYFIDSCIVSPTIASDAGLREAIYGKFKWLFLPGECTSDQIRSLSIWYTSRALDGGNVIGSKGRTARVRIKDSGGNPVTINKLATKSLLVEYTFTMVSL